MKTKVPTATNNLQRETRTKLSEIARKLATTKPDVLYQIADVFDAMRVSGEFPGEREQAALIQLAAELRAIARVGRSEPLH